MANMQTPEKNLHRIYQIQPRANAALRFQIFENLEKLP
jgi:hypothetical protein